MTRKINPIKKWFAWHPVQIDDEWVWLKPVYRYYMDRGWGDGFYIYTKTHEEAAKIKAHRELS